MAVSQHTTNRQVVIADTLAELVAETGLHAGMYGIVVTGGAVACTRYSILPAGSKSISSPHVVACTGSTSCQLADDYGLGNQPGPHASAHISGGNDVIDSVNITTSGLVPRISTGYGTRGLLITTDGQTASWVTGIGNAYISLDAAIAPSKIAQVWHITDGADIAPNRVDISRGLEILADGTGGVFFQTNFAVPGGPVPEWSGLYYPAVVAYGAGIGFDWDAGSSTLTIKANPNPFDELKVTLVSGTTWLHKFHRETSVPFGGSTNIVLTETTWRGDATKIPGDNPGSVTASITVRLIGRADDTGNAIDHVYQGTIQFVRANNAWAGSVSFTKNTYLSIGANGGTDLYAAMNIGGTRNGTITFTIVNTATGSPSEPSSATCIIDIMGGGKYNS